MRHSIQNKMDLVQILPIPRIKGILLQIAKIIQLLNNLKVNRLNFKQLIKNNIL